MPDLERKARLILRNAGQKSPPTDLERVLAFLRLHHERPWHLSTDVWEGLSRPTRGRTRITRQERTLRARGRWRLAHEVGHHVLHGAEPHLRAGSWEAHELELEADLFAAEILMPGPWLERVIEHHEHAEIEELAREFRVGVPEMEKRLRQLGLLKREVLGRM
jgi:hypothetical protein